MVKFFDVDPDELENMGREGRRGRVSYPIIKGFLETGKWVQGLDRTGMHQSTQTLYTGLRSYIERHDLPIKMFSRGGQIIFMRLDIDRNGNAIPDWRAERTTEGHEASFANDEPMPIDGDEVARRFLQEKDQTTK